MVEVMELIHELTPGEMSHRSGVAVSALHFYEHEGLINSRRTGGNQRRYARETLRRVAFIRMSQRLGIPLARIREALATLPTDRVPTSKDWAPDCRPAGARISMTASCTWSGCATISPAASAAAA